MQLFSALLSELEAFSHALLEFLVEKLDALGDRLAFVLHPYCFILAPDVLKYGDMC